MAKCILAKYGGSSYNGAKVLEGEYRSSTLYVDDYKDGDIITFTASSDIDTTPDPAQGIMGGLNVCNNKTHTTLNMTVSPYVIKAGVVYLKVTNVSGSVWHLSNLDKVDASKMKKVFYQASNINNREFIGTTVEFNSSSTLATYTIGNINIPKSVFSDYNSEKYLIKAVVSYRISNRSDTQPVTYLKYGTTQIDSGKNMSWSSYYFNFKNLSFTDSGDYYKLRTNVELTNKGDSYVVTVGFVSVEVYELSDVKSMQLIASSGNSVSAKTISEVDLLKAYVISGNGYFNQTYTDFPANYLVSSTSLLCKGSSANAIIEFN